MSRGPRASSRLCLLLLTSLVFLLISSLSTALDPSPSPSVESEENGENNTHDNKDLDYSLFEAEEKVVSTTPPSFRLFDSIFSSKSSAVSNKNDQAGTIQDIWDVVKLLRFVFLRGHIILDASHRVILKNESRIERLMNYLHDIQLRRGKHRLLPMEDRDLACDELPPNNFHMQELCKAATFDCLSASDLIKMLPPTVGFHQAITRLCPLLLFRQSRPICVADLKKRLDEHLNRKIKLVEPSIERVWGFGVLFVTISIVVSMGGLVVLPFLKKSSRMTILTFFEGLAVGGLAGSAILHLFPQAFDIVDEKYRAYFWNTFSIFLGIYIFYCIEMALKIMKTYKNKTRKKRVNSSKRPKDLGPGPSDMNYNVSSNSLEESNTSSSDSSSSDSSESSDEKDFRRERKRAQYNKQKNNNYIVQMVKVEQVDPTTSEIQLTASNLPETFSSPREQLVQCLSTVNVVSPPPPTSYSVTIQRQSMTPKLHRQPSKERMVPNVASRRQDHETSNMITVDTVAWMIVLGDALLNFIDGLSIGAAFDRNILAGISISIAVMLEEVTHRLGTFAVLIRAGMSMKQSFLYIFLSGCACYPGLALGIFLGDEAEDASPYIFALAGGFFLYMALVDVMKAMNRTMENASRKNLRHILRIWGLQNLGIVLAAISLALLAFYEKDMDFEQQEYDEIKSISFV